jgi:hypothetical protein
MSVVQFPKREDVRLVWRCGCDCLTHYAHADGRIECAACGNFAGAYPGDWRLPLPEEPAVPAFIEPGDHKVTDLNSPELSIKRALRHADPANLAALVLVNKDGSTSVWSESFDTDEQRAWITRKLAEIGADIVKDRGAP